MSDNPWGQQQELADDFSDLDAMGADYQAQHAFLDKLETLADGPYDFEIESGKLDHIKGDRVLRLTLKTGGRRIEHLYWLNRQETLNGLAADLCTLGFDADKWGPAFNRPLSVELPKAVAKLAGIKFRGIKTSRADSRPGVNKVYHDLRAQTLISGRPMPATQPAANGPAPTAAARPAPQPNPAPAVPDDDSIPF